MRERYRLAKRLYPPRIRTRRGAMANRRRASGPDK
jgi:hypothetical protein